MQDSILIVDDEEKVIASLRRALMDEPYEIFSSGGGREALEFLGRSPVKLIISDERMPGMSGAEFLSEVRQRMPETVRIMLTGHASLDAAMRAVNSGEIYRFFVKPWNDLELTLAIRSGLEKFNLEEENRRLLKIVKRQALDLKLLELKYPSITRLEKDDQGNLILPDVSEEELSEIVARCEREFS